MSLLTAEEYTTLAGRTTAPTAQIEALCEAASAAVETYIGRPLERATRTELYCATGTKYIALKVRPVVSITSVYYDPRAYYGDVPGSFAAESLLVSGVDYALARPGGQQGSGLLVRIVGLWPEYAVRRDVFKLARDLVPSIGDVKVTYVAGFDPIPPDMKLATSLMVSRAVYSIRYGSPLGSETLGDWSYKFMDLSSASAASELGSARQLLSRYREVPW